MLAFFQRSLMYPATQVEQIVPQAAGLAMGRVHSISIQTTDGLTLHGWHVLPEGTTAVDQASCDKLLQQPGPVVLFFHGNGGNRIHRSDEYQILTGLKCHVITFDYRGYGENPGSPSESKLAADATAAWNYLIDERKVAANRIVLFGESLGGGVATRLAAEVCESGTPPGGLILRSTFSSMVDAAGYNYPWLPVRLVLVDRYLSITRIPLVTCPILIFHGRKDGIVPFQLGKRLFDAAPEQSATGIPKTFVELPHSDHNDYLMADGPLLISGLREFFGKLKSQVR
ncbi:MAG: Acylglycerol lipase [Planctomycetaceae bacterium]|nr:Acylglycerol lipase [Planctomycetaceae bacterium]